jgi:hypothetical protein
MFAHSTNKGNLTFSAKSNYVISNTMVVFILYLLFPFSNGNSVIRMVVWWNLSTKCVFVIILTFVCSFCSFYCIFITTAIMWHS